MDLSAAEIRVLGCLLEKQRTTPDAYPLSLNALRLACNQSTNRDPVVDYDDAVIRDALHRLERRGLTRLASGAGSRAAKHRHLLAQALPMDAGEQAIVCVLMLRGPQTPGELKQRTERMHAFSELDGVNETLRRLIERGLVARLDRRPGHKEERYVQLLQADDGQEPPRERVARSDGVREPPREQLARSDDVREPPREQLARAAPAGQPPELDGLHERVARLEREVAELRAAMRHPVGEQQP
jgi:uncharacterized protein